MKTILLLIFTLICSININSQCQLVSSGSPQGVTCNGDCDGSIVYVYENQNLGSPGSPYIVTLQDGQSNNISTTTYINEMETILFSNLCADEYTIYVQGSQCSDVITVTVTEPDSILVYANTTQPSFGNNDGVAEIVASGGTPGYTYSIDNGATFQASNTFTGLAPGGHSVIVEDNNGCQQTVTFSLADNTQCYLTLTNMTFETSCYGYCDGSVDYIYQSGNYPNPPYVVELIQNGSVQQSITTNDPNGQGSFDNLCAGTYDVTVTDAQGCTFTNSIIINQPPLFAVTSVTTTDATAGNNDGSATINVTGGTPPYSYSLNGSNFQSSNTFNGLAVGFYVVLVEDAQGCQSNYTFVIQETPGCSFNLTTNISDSLSCYNSCDASIDYIFAGTANDPPFSIILEVNGNQIQSTVNQNQTVTGTFNGLCAGQYTITITNSSGCSETATITITNPDPIFVMPTTVDATPGNNDGQINVGVSGGTPPYQYSIDNQNTWQSTPTFTGLASGPYIVYVQDANGCIAFMTVYVNESAGCDFFLSGNPTPVTCNGDCDGSIVFSFNDPGNNPDYLVELWQANNVIQNTTVTGTNAGFGQFDNLCEGAYSVIVTDASGCKDTVTSYVGSPNPLQIDSVSVNNATAGNNDGSATVTVSGGTAPYQYSIDVGSTWQSSNQFTGLAPGFYNAIVEDDNGCISTLCFTVNEDPGCNINTTMFPSSPISCNGVCDGELTYSYVDFDSNPPYSITLSLYGNTINSTTSNSNNSTGTFDNLCAGNYSITVADANGCTSFVANYMLNQPDPLNISANVTDASTGNSNGSVTINVTGGTGQYSYSLDGNNYQSSNYFDSLAAGTYIAYVEDANGCSDIYTFVVDENAGCNIVLTSFNDQMVSCAGACDGIISFSFNDVNNNPPYTVSLTNVLQGGSAVTQLFINGNGGSGTFTNVCAGVYLLTVQDQNGCESFNTIQVTEPEYLNITASQVNPSIGNNDGSIALTTSGGTAPYEYSIDGQSNWQISNEFNNLGAGVYIIHIKDANGCVQIICVVLVETDNSSIQEFSDKLSVYPNPTVGKVWINSSSIKEVALIDVSGKVISVEFNLSDNGGYVDLSKFSSGMYILQIEMNSSEFHRFNVIKE